MGMRAEIYKGVTRALSRALRTPQYIILFVSDSCWMKCSIFRMARLMPD